jgi:hypothetical protein
VDLDGSEGWGWIWRELSGCAWARQPGAGVCSPSEPCPALCCCPARNCLPMPACPSACRALRPTCCASATRCASSWRWSTESWRWPSGARRTSRRSSRRRATTSCPRRRRRWRRCAHGAGAALRGDGGGEGAGGDGSHALVACIAQSLSVPTTVTACLTGCFQFPNRLRAAVPPTGRGGA